jgi:ADP-ribose pyrophosphatase
MTEIKEGVPMKPVFVFGTLMDLDLFSAIISKNLTPEDMTPAIAKGWKRVVAAGKSYPMLVPSPDGEVHGFIIHNLDSDDLAKMQFYETDEYQLTSIALQVDDQPIEAQVYLNSGRLTASDQAWSFDDWKANGKALAVAVASQVMPLFGQYSLREIDIIYDRIEEQLMAELAAAA